MTTATGASVAHTFLTIPSDSRSGSNWGCWAKGISANHPDYDPVLDPEWCADPWNVSEDTYINGLMLTIDMDYYMGYLIEVVERESGVVSYMAIATYHGGTPPKHDWTWWPGDAGTFFERNIISDEVSHWGVTNILGMIDSHIEIQRKEKE